MIEKSVQCPKCRYITKIYGDIDEIKKVKCSACGLVGKFIFKKSSNSVNNISIEVKNLRKEYGKLIAVNNISLSIKKGEVFAFLGPNGAGKTTTVEMIESIRVPTEGLIKIFGKDIRTSFDEIKDKIGIVPQEFHSFERLNVHETLVYYSKVYKNPANIKEIINAMNLNSEKYRLYKDLSGGLKQRVGVAIALVNNPDIIFLDEPTTGLDPKARREVWDVISNLRNKGKTVFLTTHYMEEAEYLADHIAIIHKGKIIAEGSLEELIEEYGEGTIIRITDCNTSKVIDKLQRNDFILKIEGNRDILINIDHKERIFDALSILRDENVGYGSIDIRRSNLEDIFLKLTGSTLLEGEK
jgi:ABC-2 type transport system ATP-binding protein